jgi:hypothetical protein
LEDAGDPIRHRQRSAEQPGPRGLFAPLLTHRDEVSLGRRDNCDRSIRTPILERPILDKQNPGASDIPRRGDGGIRNHDDTLSSSKLFIVGFRESETNIAARCGPREYDDGFKAFVGTYIGFATIDLELVRLNGNLELAGVGISTRQTSFQTRYQDSGHRS